MFVLLGVGGGGGGGGNGGSKNLGGVVNRNFSSAALVILDIYLRCLGLLDIELQVQPPWPGAHTSMMDQTLNPKP